MSDKLRIEESLQNHWLVSSRLPGVAGKTEKRRKEKKTLKSKQHEGQEKPLLRAGRRRKTQDRRKAEVPDAGLLKSGKKDI